MSEAATDIDRFLYVSSLDNFVNVVLVNLDYIDSVSELIERDLSTTIVMAALHKLSVSSIHLYQRVLRQIVEI